MTQRANELVLELQEAFGFCSCDEIGEIRLALIRFLRWANNSGDVSQPYYSELYGDAGIYYVVCAAFERLGFVEHGVSSRFPWLTQAGKDFLLRLEEIGEEIETWDDGENLGR